MGVSNNVHVSEILSKFNNHSKGLGWYFFGKHNIEFETKYSTGNVYKSVKISIKNLMDTNKTPIEIIHIFNFKYGNYETCKFTVKRI